MPTLSIINDKDEYFMNYAITLAEKAYDLGEVPVGAVLVRKDKVISEGYNLRENGKCALRHAEIDVIRRGCASLGGWRLPGCTLYVTLEPCPMCAGAIVNSRIERVVFGAYDARSGAFGSMINLNSYPLNHKPEIVGGVLEAECSALMRRFFEKLRKKREKK